MIRSCSNNNLANHRFSQCTKISSIFVHRPMPHENTRNNNQFVNLAHEYALYLVAHLNDIMQ